MSLLTKYEKEFANDPEYIGEVIALRISEEWIRAVLGDLHWRFCFLESNKFTGGSRVFGLQLHSSLVG